MEVRGMNPDQYAEYYFRTHQDEFSSLEETKDYLRKTHGDPKAPTSIFENRGTGKEITEQLNPEKPDAFVKEGAKRAGMNEKDFATMIGLPPKEEKSTEDAKKLE